MAAEPTARLCPAEEAEVIAAAEQAEQDATGEHVVGFGCRAADHVFLAAVPGQRHMPYNLTVPECPGCGGSHEIRAMPRPRRPRDEISLTVEPPDDPTTPKDPGSANRKVTDAAIFDAIPADHDVTAGAAAETLEVRSDSLIRRLRRINAREDKKGVVPPFILTPPRRQGQPMLVRRAGS